MPPKAAEKKPSTGGKAPAGKAPAEKKEAGKKTAAPSGDKKKRTKTRKETYSSYIYKGTVRAFFAFIRVSRLQHSPAPSFDVTGIFRLPVHLHLVISSKHF